MNLNTKAVYLKSVLRSTLLIELVKILQRTVNIFIDNVYSLVMFNILAIFLHYVNKLNLF